MIEAGFARQVAPDFVPEGRRAFRRVASSDALRDRLDGDYVGWVAEAKGEDGTAIVGYAERVGSHLQLLFVHPEWQRRGIAGRLLAAATAGLSGVTLTVNASPFALPAYARLGFVPTGPRFVRNGIVATPMALELA